MIVQNSKQRTAYSKDVPKQQINQKECTIYIKQIPICVKKTLPEVRLCTEKENYLWCNRFLCIATKPLNQHNNS